MLKVSPIIPGLLSLALALSACNPSTSLPQATGAGLSGQVVPISVSADKLLGTVTDPLLLGGSVKLLSPASYPDGVEQVDGSIDGGGAVSLPLSAAPTQESFYFVPPPPSNCTFTGTASNVLGRINLYGQALAYTAQGDPLATLSEKLTAGAASSEAIVARIYADSNQDVQGNVQCAGGYALSYDVSLTAGWNAVELVSNQGGASYKNLSDAARSVLSVTRLAAGVGVSLDSPSLTLKSGERLTLSATLSPMGGYSGAVTLSTDVPGLTVEPGAVTIGAAAPAAAQNLSGWTGERQLRALSTSSLRAQGLNTTLTFVAAANAPHFSGPANIVVTGSDGKVVGKSYLQVNLQ